MGGLGSTRWAWYNKKTQVEECIKLSISNIKGSLKPRCLTSLTWSQGGEKIANIGLLIQGSGDPEVVWLMYSAFRFGSEKKKYEYPVYLQTTPLPWGGHRYWFSCPLKPRGIICGRRVKDLYLPPGYEIFGCRHCYDLTYRSSQEAHSFDSFHRMMAGVMHDFSPHMTPEDVAYILGDRLKPPPGYSERELMDIKNKFGWEDLDPHSNYLTDKELCERSGLSKNDLKRLEEARLLLPDRPSNLYRPKLLSWAKKLVFLIDEAWSIPEIKAWSKGRWNTNNPRLWPPCREDWKT